MAKTPKPRPRTGEKRAKNQPFNCDLLPESVREAILYLHNRLGVSWTDIEHRSQLAFSKEWSTKPDTGFIDWPTLDPQVIDQFPGLKLPKSSLQRWHDVRVKQVQLEVLRESEVARNFAAQFVGRDVEGANAAIINALRDQVFASMQGLSTGDRGSFMAALGDLTLAMSRIQRVELQKRKVDAEVRKLDLANAKLAAESGDPREIYLLAAQDLLKKLRTREPVRKVLDSIKDELVQELTYGADAFEKSIKARSA